MKFTVFFRASGDYDQYLVLALFLTLYAKGFTEFYIVISH